MARAIRLPRAVERIRWDDSPGAREYEVDFSDAHIAEMRDEAQAVKAEIGRLGDAPDPDEVAALLRRFVVCVAGQECYDDALAYVDAKGLGAGACNEAMSNLVAALVDMLSEHLDVERRERYARYLGQHGDELV